MRMFSQTEFLRRALPAVLTACLLPTFAVAQVSPQRATITLEVANKEELEAALAELQRRGVVLAPKIEYQTDRVVAERSLKKPDAVRIEVELTTVRYDSEGRGIFTTSSGTVWRETVPSPARSRLDPRRTYQGVITTGLIGGFRLNIDGITRELKVEPIRTP